jgi:hypothetical protein
VPSLANRYLGALLSRPPGPRPRDGYSFWQRYWASLTGAPLTRRQAQAASARLQVSPAEARKRREIFSRSSASISVARLSLSNRWRALLAATAATAAAAATGLAVGLSGPGTAAPAARPSLTAGPPNTAGASSPGVLPVDASAVPGIIRLPPGAEPSYLDVHAAPSSRSPVVMKVGNGESVDVDCVARGDVVTNPATGQSSRSWDYIGDGYIPGIFVNTQASDTTIGSC